MAIDNTVNATSQLAVDANALNQLNTLSKQNPGQALTGAAQQFEAMFINMLMKSMRDATPQDGIFDSEQTKLYQSMLDEQMAQAMAKRGIGLAAVMVKQLGQGGIQDAARAANVEESSGFAFPAAAPAPSGATRLRSRRRRRQTMWRLERVHRPPATGTCAISPGTCGRTRWTQAVRPAFRRTSCSDRLRSRPAGASTN